MDKALLYKFFAGSATPDELHEIRAWVEESPDNMNEFRSERKLFDISTVLGETGAAETKRSRGRRRWLRWSAAAAAAVALVMITLGLQHSYLQQQWEKVPMQTLRVPPGQRLSLTLADGTEVWLNSSTTIRYPGVFAGGERHIEIDGEAYLTVAKDAEHPFIVGTNAGDIRVRGTVFNVDAYSTSPDFSVRLSEGAVDFTDGNISYSLTAGQSIHRAPDGSLHIVAETNERPDWVSGILSFKDLSMPEILARFEKYYGVTIICDRESLGSQRFSGKFYLEDGAEHALNTLKHDLDFDYQSDRDFHRITITAPSGKKTTPINHKP